MLSETLEDGLAAYRIGDKIKAQRLAKSMSLQQLGAHTGLSAGMLSKIERGSLFPTLPTLMRIAMVFGLGLDHFFAEGEDRPLLEIVRRDDRVRLPDRQGRSPSYYFESLDYPVNGRKGESFLAIFPRGAPASVPHTHDGIEMLHVVDGQVTLSVHGRDHVLNAGDTITFDARFDHHYRGAGQALVVIRPEI